MLNYGSLGIQEHVSKYWSFDYSAYNLGKSMIVSFHSHGSHTVKCFDIMHSDLRGVFLVNSHD